MDNEEKALDKIDIASELKILSPLEVKSLELKERALKVAVTDKGSYLDAKKLRRELISHRTSVKDLRLTFTRKLDNLKDQFIKKQDEVLEPSIWGEAVVKERIVEWEDAERERKEAEEKRMQEIVDRFAIVQLDRKTATLDDIRRARVHIKAERMLVDAADRNKVAVKNAITAYTEYLDEAEQFITERIEQERVAEEQRLEQERLDAERKKLEEDQKAQQDAVNTQVNMQADKDRLEYNASMDAAAMSIPPPDQPIVGIDIGAPEGDQSVETATWELVVHGRHDPSDAELKKIAAKITDGFNIGEYIVEDPDEEEE